MTEPTFRLPAQARMELLTRLRAELRYRTIMCGESVYHLATNVLHMPEMKLRKLIIGTVRPNLEELADMAHALGFSVTLTITDPPHAVLLNEVINGEIS